MRIFCRGGSLIVACLGEGKVFLILIDAPFSSVCRAEAPSSAQLKPSNSADIVTSPAMKQMLKSAKNDDDYVLVDLPPILPVVDVKEAACLDIANFVQAVTRSCPLAPTRPSSAAGSSHAALSHR